MGRYKNIKVSQKGNKHTLKLTDNEALIIRIINIMKWHPRTNIIGKVPQDHSRNWWDPTHRRLQDIKLTWKISL